MKIIDKVNQKIAANEKFFSFEFFPPRTQEGVEALFERQERMVAHGPVFCDITWGAGGSTADVTLDIATTMQSQICIDTMMHLTCTNMPVEKLDEALKEVKKHGLQNILALRGDPPKGQEKFEAIEGGFNCALDLVKYIRSEFGDYFGICVAGYPEAHPDTIVEDPVQMEKNYQENIAYLKNKVEAGGEFIITQLFYDIDVFFKFVKDCRSAGINVPILPGIMPIMTYGGFKRMTGFCKTKVPQELSDKIEELKDNEEALKLFGMDHGADMCRKLLAGGVPGLHMYSLNLEATVFGILERIGFIDTAKVPRHMPWRLVPMGTRRQVEGVRPISWANRSRSYITKTSCWNSFPTNSWGAEQSKLLSLAIADSSAKSRNMSEGRKKKSLEAWGSELSTLEDVKAVFTKYFKGEISLFPWSDAPAQSSASVLSRVEALINTDVLPIHVQSSVHDVASEDAGAGWGGPGGYVYQKGYVEAFVSPSKFKELLPKLKSSSNLTYVASNNGGDVHSNASASGISAVTWGVFAGKEVVQPYIFDKDSFLSWKGEAFSLWESGWAALYETGSASSQLLKDMQSSWYLVAILDNEFVPKDPLAIFGA